jgi:alkanesulfonate monooxygenase SsuD/methylene tetrahydromethanopterin reductase-like flavin-dependent oxidoreductase (luciferase family)
MRFDVEFPNAREGVFVPPGYASPDQIIDIVKHAEDLGYWAVWATDFITPTPQYGIPEGERPDWYEPLISIAFCAAHTKTIKLGTLLILAPFRGPVILAKEVATIDHFSHGRMLLGLGLGMCRDEFDALMPRHGKAHRGNMMDECIELVTRLCSDEKDVSFEGTYNAVKGANLFPKPVQNPLPIYVPCRATDSYERIAKWGLNITAPGFMLRKHMDALSPLLEANGRKLSDIDIIAEGEVFFGKSRDDAAARYAKTRHGQFRLKRQPLEAFLEQNWVGTVDEIIDKMSKLKEQGLTHFNILHVPADSIAERKELMQRFAEEVMPALR